jgi:hypothetical protein
MIAAFILLDACTPGLCKLPEPWNLSDAVESLFGAGGRTGDRFLRHTLVELREYLA